ncbi:MAG TPA: TatD family hydrolase [Candidatus Saccharibacteria bacterium]|nr:TatD family hydrolase [Candidatus Saccharibacteria bacterium]HRQ06527.1 TatD family hydrolase [Candidatus Saccharibacteria bacterium]
MLVDTHCHIHESDYPIDIAEVLTHARESGVKKLICVGTNQESSRLAVKFAANHENSYASVGVHPHEAKDGWGDILEYRSWSREDGETANSQIPNSNGQPIAIGEIGLDYFYSHSPRVVQIQALEAQIDLAVKNNLPIIFHVRDAFDDFWPILDNFSVIKGVLHSFTDNQDNLKRGLERGLYVGVNGISTFTKDVSQQAMFDSIPLDKLLLETDAPFLTPVPLRGKVNEPAFVRNVAEFHAAKRGISLDEISATTTANAFALFAL